MTPDTRNELHEALLKAHPGWSAAEVGESKVDDLERLLEFALDVEPCEFVHVPNQLDKGAEIWALTRDCVR